MKHSNYIKTLECRLDFWNKLTEAMAQAGGTRDIDSLAKMKLHEVVDLLAQNGIRMTYSKEWHINEQQSSRTKSENDQKIS